MDRALKQNTKGQIRIMKYENMEQDRIVLERTWENGHRAIRTGTPVIAINMVHIEECSLFCFEVEPSPACLFNARNPSRVVHKFQKCF